MKPVAFLIGFEGEKWHAACVGGGRVECAEITPTDDAGSAIAALAGQLKQWGWTGGGVCLGLPSEWVLGALIDCTDLPHKGRREAMRYRLEEQLPMDAERLTADFMPASGSRVFALAVDTLRVRGLLARLAEEGIRPAMISATALLALKDACSHLAAGTDFVVLAGPSRLDVFRLVEGSPEAWSAVTPDGEDLLRACRAQLLVNPIEGRKPTAACFGQLDPTVSRELAGEFQGNLRTINEGPMPAAAARGAATMMAEDSEGWADFLRDDLAPGSAWGGSPRLLRTTAALAVALPVVLAGMFMWRAAQYESSAREFSARQVAEYVRLYPNTPVPTSVVSRLKSEMTRQTSMSGAGAQIPAQANALEELRMVAAALPDGLLKLTEVRAGASEITLEGKAHSHADAEQAARALRVAGFEVEPPSSETDQQGSVSFSITAKYGAVATSKPPVSDGGADATAEVTE